MGNLIVWAAIAAAWVLALVVVGWPRKPSVPPVSQQAIRRLLDPEKEPASDRDGTR